MGGFWHLVPNTNCLKSMSGWIWMPHLRSLWTTPCLVANPCLETTHSLAISHEKVTLLVQLWSQHNNIIDDNSSKCYYTKHCSEDVTSSCSLRGLCSACTVTCEIESITPDNFFNHFAVSSHNSKQSHLNSNTNAPNEVIKIESEFSKRSQPSSVSACVAFE